MEEKAWPMRLGLVFTFLPHKLPWQIITLQRNIFFICKMGMIIHSAALRIKWINICQMLIVGVK